MKEHWYGVRTVYLVRPREEDLRNLYEERVTILEATSHAEAVKKAEREAKAYAEEYEMEYLDYAESYQMFDQFLQGGSEVFSLMRESSYTSELYVKTFMNTGSERQKPLN